MSEVQETGTSRKLKPNSVTARNKILSHAILILLLISALPLAIQITSENVSADSPEVWNQTSGNLASTDANWLDGTKPIAGDNVIFNATSTASCTWDLALTLGSFSMNTGYTGTVTQGVSFTVSSLIVSAGLFTASDTYTLTIGGSATIVSASWSQWLGNLVFTTDGSTYTDSGGLNRVNSITVNGNLILAGTSHLIEISLTISTGKTLTISTIVNLWSAWTFSNSGTIDGTSTLYFILYSSHRTMNFGTITCPVVLQTDSGATISPIFTVSADTIFGNSLSINSASASKTVTLDLSANNYALSANGITIGTRGILKGRASQITCSGNWDSSAGTFTASNSKVLLTGTTKTLKTATTGFNNLTVSGSYTQQSHIWAKNLSVAGTLSQATYRANATTSLIATGSWNGNLNLNGTASSYSVPITAPFNSAGRIYSKVTTTYTNGTQGSITVIPGASSYGGIRIGTLNKGHVSAANWTYIYSSGSVQFDVVLTPYMLYQMYVNGVSSGDKVLTDATGLGSWTRSVTSQSNFTLTGDPIEITSTPTTTIVEDNAYLYTPTTNYTGVTWGLDTNATWLSQYAGNGTVYGTPSNIYAHQAYFINITITYGWQSDYQNYTLTVINVAPLATSTPEAWVYVEVEFQYSASFSDFDDGGVFIGVTTNFTGEYNLDLATGLFTFRSYETGTWYFNITFDDMTGAANATGYQYFVVKVIAGGPTSTTSMIMLLQEFVLALIMAFGTFIIGMTWKSSSILMISGLSWIIGAMFVFINYGPEWLILSIGMGLLVLYIGGTNQLGRSGREGRDERF